MEATSTTLYGSSCSQIGIENLLAEPNRDRFLTRYAHQGPEARLDRGASAPREPAARYDANTVRPIVAAWTATSPHLVRLAPTEDEASP